MRIIKKAGDYMPTSLDIIKAAIDDFKKIQKYIDKINE